MLNNVHRPGNSQTALAEAVVRGSMDVSTMTTQEQEQIDAALLAGDMSLYARLVEAALSSEEN